MSFVDEEIGIAEGGCSQCYPNITEIRRADLLEDAESSVDGVDVVEIKEVIFKEE